MRSSFLVRAVVGAIAVMALAASVWAQDNSTVKRVMPTTAKVGGTLTLYGEGLGKGAVVAVFLSTTTDDFAATIVEQTDTKIVIKVPKVKPGDHNISIQVKTDILIQPIRVMIQE